MLKGIDKPNNHPAVPDINDTQFATPQNYTMDVLGQQFLVYDNGLPDRILLFGTDEGFRYLGNSQNWFWTENLNQAQFNLCNFTTSTDLQIIEILYECMHCCRIRGGLRT